MNIPCNVEEVGPVSIPPDIQRLAVSQPRIERRQQPQQNV